MFLGLFIGRLNPPHIGHISIIDKALSENSEIILMIGTKGEVDDRNPLKFSQIKKILNKKYGHEDKLKILELKDDLSDLVWVQDIKELLYKYGNGIKDINLYGGDFKTDSAYEVIKKYENELGEYNFTYIELPRENSFTEYKGRTFAISATNLRKALREKEYKLAEKFCDEKMFELIQNYFNG